MREKMAKDLGSENKIFILRNHGVAFCGETMEESLFYLTNFMYAANIQFKAMSAANGVENLILTSQEAIDQVSNLIKMSSSIKSIQRVNEKASNDVVWQLGEIDFEAEMRRMDLLVNFISKNKISCKI